MNISLGRIAEKALHFPLPGNIGGTPSHWVPSQFIVLCQMTGPLRFHYNNLLVGHCPLKTNNKARLVPCALHKPSHRSDGLSMTQMFQNFGWDIDLSTSLLFHYCFSPPKRTGLFRVVSIHGTVLHKSNDRSVSLSMTQFCQNFTFDGKSS